MIVAFLIESLNLGLNLISNEEENRPKCIRIFLQYWYKVCMHSAVIHLSDLTRPETVFNFKTTPQFHVRGSKSM